MSWKLLGRPVQGEHHVLVNRNLYFEFGAFLAAADWDVALLQEVPPRWVKPLANATGADRARTLTSRNWMRPFTFPAARLRPHLTGSWEGGSNLILVRRPSGGILEHRATTLRWRPERRVASVARLEGGICVANLHASTGEDAAGDVLRAAEMAVAFAGDAPLVLGGDFNARPRGSGVFERLERELDQSRTTGPAAIDHLLVRRVREAEPPVAWLPERRDVPDRDSDLMIRLSDHPPVTRNIRV